MENLLIALLVLGALGLFLALPGGRAQVARFALVPLAGAGAVLVAVVLRAALGAPQRAWFAGLALVALAAAVRVITHRRPVYSALYFVLVILAVTGLLVLLEAKFLAVALVIVYAGAILVTYVFVIMLAQQAGTAPYDARAREPFWGCLTGFVLLAVVGMQLLSGGAAAPPGGPAVGHAAAAVGTVAEVGTRLLTHYAVAVQVGGLLLLAAMVGAIAIARRKPGPDADGGEPIA